MKYKGILSGVKWTIFSSIFLAVLQIVQLVVIARVISKEDFGVVSIVIVFIGFLQIFMDAGISNAVIHAKKISKIEVSSLFWLNIFIGTSLAYFITYRINVDSKKFVDGQRCPFCSMCSRKYCEAKINNVQFRRRLCLQI